jgi:hypothetical protein
MRTDQRIDVGGEAAEEELFRRLREAMADDLVTAADIETLLSRRAHPGRARPAAASVLYALGSVVVFGGVAIAYGTIFGDLPWAAQIATPFVFPAAALAVGIALVRRGAPSWQSDVAGLVGYIALAAAFGVAATASGWVNSDRQTWAAVAIASALGVVVVAALHLVVRSFRLLGLGLPAALAPLGLSSAYLAGAVGERSICWVLLAEAAVAAAVATPLAGRSRRGCLYATVWATLGAYTAVYTAATTRDFSRFTVWHAILAGVVIAAFLTAGAFDLDALIWIAAAGGAVWMVMIAVIVGSATSAALAVVLAGMGLVLLGLLVTRLRRAGGHIAGG